MPSTKVLFGTLTGLILAIAAGVMNDLSVLDVVPEQWRAIVIVVLGSVVSYFVRENNPSPSTIAKVHELDAQQ